MSESTYERTSVALMCLLGMAGLLLLSPASSTAQEYAATYSDTFDGAIDPDHWTVVSNQPLFRVESTGSDLVFSKPYGGRGWGYFDYASLCFAGDLVGDFAVSVEFHSASLDVTDTGCNAASLDIFFGGQANALVRQDCESGGDTIGVWEDPQEVWQGVEVPAAVTSGRLTIVRVGETVTSSFDDFTNEAWIHEGIYNSAPVTDVCMTLGNNHSLDGVSVHFDDFAVGAEEIVYPTAQWQKVLVTSIGSDRWENDGSHYIALGFHPDGPEAAIAYTDPATAEAKVVRGTWGGSSWTWAQPEVAAPDGRALDLGYDACGDLWLSYLSGGNKRASVKVAHWDGQSWSERQIDRGAKRWMTSLAHAPSGCGPPSVTYGVDAGNEGQLRFAEGDLPPVVVDSGPAGEGVVMPPASGVGSFSSLVYSPDGAPAAAYSFLDSECCRSIKFARRDPSDWVPETVFNCGGRIIREISLGFQDGIPVTVFTDAHDAPLTVCERSAGWVCAELHPGAFGTPNLMVDRDKTVMIGAHHHPGASIEPELWLFRRPFGEDQWHVERVRGFSAADGALDSNGNPAFCYADGGSIYFAYLRPGTCASDAECDDGNPCTSDSCDAGRCTSSAVEDGSWCGMFPSVCCSGSCVTPWCTVDSDCDDGDRCTDDSCVMAGYPCESYCEYTPIQDCAGCVPTASKEKGPRCTDGIDNDCDGMTDGEDPDC